MERKTDELMVNKIAGLKQTMQIHRGGHKEEASLTSVICCWFVTVSVCLVIWAILSPLFYEQFYMTAKAGDFREWLFGLACFLAPLLLVAVSSTRKVIVETRNQYFPATNTNNADLPIRQTLVRASSEPLQAQEAVLLRAAAEGHITPPEQLVRAVAEPEAAREFQKVEKYLLK